MTITALVLAGTLLGFSGNKATIPDYAEGIGNQAPPAIVLCTLNGEDTNGPFKTCRYDCGRTLTVGERFFCPFILQ